MPLAGSWVPKVSELQAKVRGNVQSFGEIHHRLIEHYAPPSILVNEEGDILHLSENAGRYLRFAGGAPTTNLLKVIDPSLLSDTRAALFAARKENKVIEAKSIRVRFDGEERFINLTVRPVSTPEAAALVMFEEVEGHSKSEESVQAIVAGDKAMEAVVRGMEDELRHTKDQLRNTIEQYETSNEEQKASNEELQAINEELRSASEELETSKEELQSVNEELTTVNHELKDKVDEVGRINSDLLNLMQSTNIATIFLDRSLHIKRFTPRATEIFNLIPADVGRPLAHITHRLAPDDFEDDAAVSLKNLKTLERETRSSDGRVFAARFSPYRTIDDKIDGVVISFIDVTERKRAEEDLRETIDEMSRLNSAMVGREVRMIDLKKEVNELKTRLGEEPVYPLEFENDGSAA
ncbi:MAG: PAS domain-containing protein [Acidobacteria bacterium]|nr:PAS domain-containing protein [Acidobacteriota bacterium]